MVCGYVRKNISIFIFDLEKIFWKYFYRPITLEQLQYLEKHVPACELVKIRKVIFYTLCSKQQNNEISSNIYKEMISDWKYPLSVVRIQFLWSCGMICLINDNQNVFKIILEIMFNYKYEEIMHFVNTAAKYNALKCMKLLLNDPEQLDWQTERINPTVLFNSITYCPKEIDLINYIIKQLESLKICFICSDLITKIIENDLITVIKIIVRNKWHILTEKDKENAKKVGKDCYCWFKERERGFEIYCPIIHTLEWDDWDDLTGDWDDLTGDWDDSTDIIGE